MNVFIRMFTLKTYLTRELWNIWKSGGCQIFSFISMSDCVKYCIIHLPPRDLFFLGLGDSWRCTYSLFTLTFIKSTKHQIHFKLQPAKGTPNEKLGRRMSKTSINDLWLVHSISDFAKFLLLQTSDCSCIFNYFGNDLYQMMINDKKNF